MTDELDASEFRQAVADAIKGVLALYREAEALLRELQGFLGSGEPRFASLADRIAPGTRRGEPGTRYLRSFVASVLVPASGTELDIDEPDDDDDDDGEDGDEDTESTPKRKSLVLRTGAGLLVPKVEIYGSGRGTFEPAFSIALLTKSHVAPELPAGTPLKLSRSRLRKLVRFIEKSDGKSIEPRITVHPADKPKDKRKLGFTMAPTLRYPLFDVTPQKLEAIAEATRQSWRSNI